MSLAFIGLGLATEQDVSTGALELIQKADVLYLETYTSVLQCSIKDLEKFYGHDIIKADRELVEQRAEDTILHDAKTQQVCFLVIGDVFSATTHLDLYRRAKELRIPISVHHNASVLTAVGATGLQLYKFGKVTSIPLEHEQVTTPYEYLGQNKSIGAHTLFLLDLRPDENRFLLIREAIEYLLQQESKQKKGLLTKKTKAIGCARLGSKDAVIHYGTLEALTRQEFGNAPYCLIIPGVLHFMEEETLQLYTIRQ
ncbi:diphthine synthase [Candidatus Woesearchaeota archaeon]|nr:diphthine synthase [Candidatus Woesearchaeota archaeon]